MERTLLLVKPDGVQRGLVGTIIDKVERRGLRMVGVKLMSVSAHLAETHYAIHKGKPFYNGLIDYITSAPVVAIVWQGSKAVSVVRQVLGSTDPTEAQAGTVRGDYGIDIGRNLTHGSDSVKNGLTEINLWFKPDELIEWKRSGEEWVFEI